MKVEFSEHIFKICSNIKLNEIPSSGSRVVPCGWTDMTKLIVDFINFANAFKNSTMSLRSVFMFFCRDFRRKNDISLHSINRLVLYPELSL